ncbi:Flavorubredoxin [Caldanaerobius fijiensis DSM 17918]|uniref:Flavorubredoxin n=1 Tax=Caldanaerobius fijiensis DSM 17918 TaxID=1121256 RepID=A0A1M5BUU4_9THEO|nr:FprA family A-type flavoprotein [Caldanaerobius fijiensis]SHF46334.1 Flavorubredoxin [Caldanaerobius fijiensis DSM 17918]
MKAFKIKDETTWVGVMDKDLLIFDIVFPLNKGTTYNSYLIKGEKIALIDTVKEPFFDEFFEKIASVVEPAKIDYIIINHTEPDHSGALAKLLERVPEAIVVGSRSAIQFARGITNKEFKSQIVKQGDTIDLGGKTLEFIMAPFLHWPDTMFTYLREDKILFTCDAFGAHYCPEDKDGNMFNDTSGEYFDEFKYYYESIMSPFKPKILEAIDKIKGLDIDIIAPSHGPILRERPWFYVDKYKEWSDDFSNLKDIVVVYASAYTYTAKIADAIVEGMQGEGGVNIKVYNILNSDRSQVISDILKASGVLVGSPTINGDVVKPIWDMLTSLNPLVCKGKYAAAFGSFGWSGEAVPMMEERLKQLKFKVIQPGIRINFKPSTDDIDKCREFGKQFVKQVLSESSSNLGE